MITMKRSIALGCTMLILLTLIIGCKGNDTLAESQDTTLSSDVAETTTPDEQGQALKHLEKTLEIKEAILGQYGVQDCFLAVGSVIATNEPTVDIRLTLNQGIFLSYNLEQAITEIVKNSIPEIKEENISITDITEISDDDNIRVNHESADSSSYAY